MEAIAAIKNPTDDYRDKVSERSGYKLLKATYPYELGWVYVTNQKRDGGLARSVVGACLEVAGPAGVFATTRANNGAMQHILTTSGFERVGVPYDSDRGTFQLVVFVRGLNKTDQQAPNPIIRGKVPPHRSALSKALT